jgi:hypothetical protein
MQFDEVAVELKVRLIIGEIADDVEALLSGHEGARKRHDRLANASGAGFALQLVLKAHGLEYPRDCKLLNIGGVTDNHSAATTSRVSQDRTKVTP